MRNRAKENYRWDLTEIYGMCQFPDQEPLDWCRLALIACRRRQRLSYSKLRQTRLFYASAATILENRIASVYPERVTIARNNLRFYTAGEYRKMKDIA